MRTDINAAVVTAMTTGSAYKMYTQVVVEPTRLYFATLDNSDPPTANDAAGLLDNPVMQSVGVTTVGYKLVTWYNSDGYLKYQVEGSATLVNTGQTCVGRPGARPDGTAVSWVAGDGQLMTAEASSASLEAHSASPWSTGPTDLQVAFDTSKAVAVHMFSGTNNALVVIFEYQGGFRAEVFLSTNSWEGVIQPGRFMFPLLYQIETPRALQGLLAYSTAVRNSVTGDIFVYISNHLTGGVDAVQFYADSNTISDIFTAVPTDLKASICELRVSSAFNLGGNMFLAGSFLRRENVSALVLDTMILRSTDGRSWTMDRFSLVANLGYHMYVAYDNNSGPTACKLKISNCNRVASKAVTWLYDGVALTGGVAQNALTIDRTGIFDLSDEQVSQLDLNLASADETYMYDARIQEGAKLTLKVVFSSTAGDVATTYGTYFIDAITRGVRDGARQFSLSCINMSLWELQGMSSPFYTEIVSKSSVRDNLDDENTTQLYTAEFSGVWESEFSVDFWELGEPWDEPGESITGMNIHKNGGVDRTTGSGNHKCGVRTADLKENISCEEYPTIIATSATFQIWGWSYADSGNDNDEVQLRLWLELPDGTLTTATATGSRWPCTYPSSAAGDFPIEYTFNGLTIGTKIREMGLIFINSSTTYIYPCRIDCTAGTATYYGSATGSASWYSAEDKLYKVRAKGYPHIMFSRQPYDTFNFIQAGKFSCDVSVVGDYYGMIGYGLVGLAQDGRNYILARWNKVIQKLELIKVRNGQETQLVYSTTVFTMAGPLWMMFSHKDGHFEVRVLTDWQEWVNVLEYDWLEQDGYLFTSDTMAKHCGIWGAIMVPYFRITGFDSNSGENTPRATAIPVMPGYSDFGHFPISGTCEIGESVFSYTGKAIPSPVDGPYQYRQSDLYNGKAGVQIRMFDWTGTSDMAGALLAIDDGTVYVIKDTDWSVNQDGPLPGRTLIFVDEDQMRQSFHTLSNRCYVTGGLTGAELMRGEAGYYSWGDYCFMRTTGTVQCYGYFGSSGDTDVTVEDLVHHLSVCAGAVAQFPGDIYYPTQQITSGNNWEAGTIEFPDGMDIRFKADTWTIGKSVMVYTSAHITEQVGDSYVRVRIQRYDATTFQLWLSSQPSATIIEGFTLEGVSTANPSIRVLFHKAFITVYINGAWYATFHTNGITYDTYVFAYILTDDNVVSLSDVRIQELSDWREAIYIDLETDGNSAIQSVIQERPVEIYPRWDGSIAYWYDPDRSTVTLGVKPREHSWVQRIPTDAASDAIVYYSEVTTLLNSNYKANYGFSTRVYRLPNLESGAIRAAKIMLEKAFSERKRHSISIRPDLRIEPGDKLAVSYTATGTNRATSFTMVVDELHLSQDVINSEMTVGGREV